MALKQQQDLLARLYTDVDFQLRFLAFPLSFNEEFGLEAAEAESLARVASSEVRWFSESLVRKRLREVAKLLPLTKRAMGTEFDWRFLEFSAKFKPTSIKKHLEDALAFADSVLSNPNDAVAKSIVRFETARLRHNAFGRWLSICMLRHDPRSLPALDSGTDLRKGIGIWIAIGRRSRILFR